MNDNKEDQLFFKWNSNKTYQHQCIHNLFEAQVAQSPDAIAVVFEDKQLTYQQLNQQANQLAHRLRSLRVGPEVLVGICIERSLEMIVGLLGILKAGGAYVPLDPTYPEERLAYILDDAQVSVLLTQNHLIKKSLPQEVEIICLDSDWNSIALEKEDNLLSDVIAENLAYVIYTSGSTGKPKGVQICHRSVIHLLFGVDYVCLDSAQSFLQAAPISFDASTFEVWGALLHGAQCVLFPGKILTSKALSNSIQKHGITILWLTSALFNFIINEAPEALIGIKQLLIGGESLSVAHVRRALKILPSIQIINAYGPTECTTFACSYLLPKHLEKTVKSIPIGCPIGNTQVYILDTQLQPVPVGVPGELHISGNGLARGYLNRSELTAEKFILNPFSKKLGARLYKTGDMARYLPDGNIEFLGRLDYQVKLRGFRIELEEIEAVLGQHPAVHQCVVIIREDITVEKCLVAYLVTNQKFSFCISGLRGFLKEKLPSYMLPSIFVLLDTLPLTSNGKIDKKALPKPHEVLQLNMEVDYVEPTNNLELFVVKVWREVLGLEQVGVMNNFFDLGGTSLLLGSVQRLLEQRLHRDISLLALFEYPTIKDFVQYLNNKEFDTSSLQKKIQHRMRWRKTK